jgi:CMP-N-acetylneuraminic acid synthetase
MPIAIVPIKKHSRRVPNKNFLDLSGKPLLSYIFESLKSSDLFEDIYCYTSDVTISELLPQGIKILPRDAKLDSDSTTHEDLWVPAIKFLPPNSTILMTHATSPFLSVAKMHEAFELFREGTYDSVFGVQEIKSHIWFEGKPLNYNLGNLTPTQSIRPIYRETNGLYIFKREGFLSSQSRIHGRSKYVVLDDIESIDIDTSTDFRIAESIAEFGGRKS